MRSIILVLLMVIFVSPGAIARQDTTAKPTQNISFPTDSVATVQPAQDTIPAMLRLPDSLRHNQYIDTLLKQYAFNPFLFNSHSYKQTQLRMGHSRPYRDVWVIFIILLLLIYAGLLNRIMSKDILNVVQGFYFKSSFAKLGKEDNLLTSWSFICLFILFGFTIGLFIYQVIIYNNLTYSISGMQLFAACSVLVIILSVAKIMLLRILGFIFDIPNIIRDYIAILYLTYFNIAFIFLPVVICFSLFPAALMPYLLDVSIGLIVVVVLIQYGRSILNIISNFTFHKIYLFIYLCALEICPILILIKALSL